MRGIRRRVRERHLVRAERALVGNAVDLLRAGPAFRRIEHDHRPARPRILAALARGALRIVNLLERPDRARCHRLVHRCGFAAGDEMRRPAEASQQLLELLPGNAREDRRIGDLVAVQVQDRQHRSVGLGVQEFVRVPCGRERTGFGLAVADHAGDNERGIVEHRAERMTQAVAEFAALVDRAGAFGRRVTRNSAGKRELLEQAPQAVGVAADLRVDLAIGALEVGARDHRGSAVTRSRHVDHVEIVLLDDPIQMRVNEILAGCRAPVAEQHALDVLRLQRLAQQRIIAQINLPDCQIIRGPPIRVELAQLFGIECRSKGYILHDSNLRCRLEPDRAQRRREYARNRRLA